jgi:hypothetical protein
MQSDAPGAQYMLLARLKSIFIGTPIVVLVEMPGIERSGIDPDESAIGTSDSAKSSAIAADRADNGSDRVSA